MASSGPRQASASPPVAPSPLDQRVIEHRFVVVLARDDNDFVPDARIDDPLAVHLSSEAFLVDAGKRVTRAVHTPAPVAPSDDRDELACLLVIVSRDKLGQRLLRGSTTQEGHDVLSVAPPLVLPSRFAKSDVNGAFGARRADEDAVARVALARIWPLIRLSRPLPHEPPILWEICGPPAGRSGHLVRGVIGADGLDDRVVEACLRELEQEWAEFPIRNMLQGDRER